VWFGAQRETLIRQLDTNTEEIESTVQELDMHEESEEQNYQLLVAFQFLIQKVCNLLPLFVHSKRNGLLFYY